MSLKHKEIEINPESPFANCKLERKQYADILTDIVKSYSEGFVLAINNKWGTGKTTFVKMWEQSLRNKGFKTVYFNAWENDFENNPLIALMGELKTLTSEQTEPKFKSTLKKAALLSKHIVPIATRAIADRYIDTKEFKEAVVEITKGITDIFENQVDEYSKKKKGISEFKDNLSEFITNVNEDKPLIFIIDELDRCRPDYAVSTLEQIKHFFSVPKIVFVLSIDRIQLGNAVRGVYGSEKIDAHEYLSRFIDIEFSIPEPSKGSFFKYLYEYLEFDTFFINNKRIKHYVLSNDKDRFFEICEILFSKSSITLRQQEKIFILARLSLRAFKSDYYVLPILYIYLIFIKTIHQDFYNRLKSQKLTISELQDNLFKSISYKPLDNNYNSLMYLEAMLIIFYNNSQTSGFNKKNIYKISEKGKKDLLFYSIFDKSNKEKFLRYFYKIETSTVGGLSLDYFINKIDLLESLEV